MSSEPNPGKSPKAGNSGRSPEAGEPTTPPRSRFLDRRLGGKSIWDWLDLFSKLAIPVVVLAATIWFTGWQSHLTDLQHQDDITDTYIGNIKDLLNQGLRTSSPEANIRQIAEEQTITTLRRLNVQHNIIVLQFLQDAHLIGAQNTVIDLSNADLSYDHLSNAPLSDINLRNADLSHADLTGADLSGATMNGTDLIGASLSGATLTSASLSDAILTGADLSGARLGDAILSSASLSGADLSGADLGGADPTPSLLGVRCLLRSINPVMPVWDHRGVWL